MTPKLPELKNVAQAYCALIESSSDENDRWLEDLAALLPRLHAAAASLGRESEKANHTLTADLDARFELYTHLRELLGERDGYWMEFDVAEDAQCMSGSLADDLTDIYCELKHGLKLLDGSPDTAEECWRQGFQKHWKQHLVDAQRHLNTLRAKGKLFRTESGLEI
jgi:hypothetical protein